MVHFLNTMTKPAELRVPMRKRMNHRASDIVNEAAQSKRKRPTAAKVSESSKKGSCEEEKKVGKVTDPWGDFRPRYDNTKLPGQGKRAAVFVWGYVCIVCNGIV